MTKRQFVLVVVDRDTGEFTVEGPMSDDRLWNSAVVDAQRVGRNIRCFSIGDIAADVAATEWHSSYGGCRIASGSIVSALTGAALTKAPVLRPPGPHASIFNDFNSTFVIGMTYGIVQVVATPRAPARKRVPLPKRTSGCLLPLPRQQTGERQ